MKKSMSIFLVLLAYLQGSAQTSKSVRINDCYALARQNYPLIKQRELIEKSGDYSVENISKGFLPQVSISGQATYQSDVTEIPIKLPGVSIPSLPKDQYKLYGEINQPITDLITVKQQKESQKINSAIQEENLETELYKLKDRINQLFFGILLADEQIAQNELVKKDLQAGIDKANATIKNGTGLKSSADKLKAELLKADQHTVELRSLRRQYMQMLGLFLNQDFDESAVFEKPTAISPGQTITRPELIVYDSKNKIYDLQKKIVTTKNLPKLNLFFQGGFGQPSPVNFLSDKLSPYYLGGVRLNWSLSGLYTINKEKKLIELDRKINDVQKETFLFNINYTLKQQSEEIKKIQELIQRDDEIVVLQESIKKASDAQLENGVITANDYLRDLDADDQAKRNRLFHEVQLLIAQYSFQNTTGN